MNDEFLTRLHKTPRAEFADALYEHISSQSQTSLTQRLGQRLPLRNAVIMFALLLFIAGCVYVISEKRWNKIGGIWVDVQKTLKLEFDPSEPRVVETPANECVTVEEARKILSFDFQVPAWAPAGFIFANTMCGVTPTSDSAGLSWARADKDSGISLTVQKLPHLWKLNGAGQGYEIGPASTGPVAPGSYKEVQINGEPAVLVRGDWEEPWGTERLAELKGKVELKWDKKRGLQLYWVKGEVLYYLSTRAKVSVEDLIRMAESTQ